MKYEWSDFYKTLNITSDSESLYGIASPCGLTISKNTKSGGINRSEYHKMIDAITKHFEEKGMFIE